jgi:hypothetical protein
MRRVEFAGVKSNNGQLLNECADQLATRGVDGSSYGPFIRVPADDPESEEELVMNDEDLTQRDEWDDPEHRPPTGIQAFSVGLAADEQEEVPQCYPPSPFSSVLRWAMEHPPQPEIVLVSSESLGPSPVTADDSGGELPIPDPDDSGVVHALSGNGFPIVNEESLWIVPQMPFRDHLVVQPKPFPGWTTAADQHTFNIEGKEALPWDQFKDRIAESGEMTTGVI